MERLTEEQITRFLIGHLKKIGFNIFSYDFPQSGTGYILRPNSTEIKHKNINFWIPDIIAIKDRKLYLFENKDHYSNSDIKKIQSIRQNRSHSEAIDKLLYRTKTDKFFFILGFPINFYKPETQITDFIDAEIGCDLENDLFVMKTNNTDIEKALKNL
jgi:hypothetical protein